MVNGSRRYSDSCHVVTLSVVTGRSEDYILGRMFASCLRLRNSLAGNARHRLFRLMQDAEYRALKAELKMLPAGSRDACRGEVTRRLKTIRESYGLGSFYQFVGCVAPFRKAYFKKKAVPSHIAQTIAEDVWQGVETVLFSNGRMLSLREEYSFTTLRGKSNAATLRFDPAAMRLMVGDMALCVRAKDDEYMREDLARMRASFESERAGRGALPGCIRYCTLQRRLVNDHGTVKWGYRLLVACDGSAPRRKACEPLPGRDSRTLAVDPSMAMMACADDSGACGFVFLDGKDPLAERTVCETAVRLDQSRRSSNPERYDVRGRFIKDSVNAATGGKEMNRSAHYEDLYMKRKLMLQKRSDNLRGRRGAICNTLVRSYGTIKTEGMQYVALSARAKDVRYAKGGRIASKSRYGSTIQRFAPATFLAELKRKAEASGATYVEVNPWTLKASQYDPTVDMYVKHKLSERVFRLADGTAVQRDLMAAFTILHSKHEDVADAKTGKKRTVDIPNREAMLAALPPFVRAMHEVMDGLTELKRQLPAATGAGAWTTPQGAGKEIISVDAPHSDKGEIPVLQRICGGGLKGRRGTSGSAESIRKRREGYSPLGTPLL